MQVKTTCVRWLLLSALAAGTLTGCSMGPAYERPAADLPASWSHVPAGGQSIGKAAWWTVYADPALDRLVNEALASNQDLVAAAARLDEARALLGVTRSQQYPAVGASFSRDRSRSSERSATPLPPSVPLERNDYTATIDVAYEIDLWGRLASQTRAARAQVLAAEAAQRTVEISLTATVVQAYYTLLGYDAQVAATQRALDLRIKNLELQRVRNQAGLLSDFEYRQLEAEVASARAQLPLLERDRAATEGALGVLLGRSPRDIMNITIARSPDAMQPAPAVVPEGLPSDLLLQRPDVVQAEQEMIAANARIAAARAALFPRISLTGYLGSESAALGDLFSGPATIWQLAFGLAQPVFQGGRLFAEVEAVEARERQAIANYQKTLQSAFREVRDALITQTRNREAFQANTERVAALTEALRLARVRYANGLTSQLEVLDVERNLLQAEINRADALRGQRIAVAGLIKALGGSWNTSAANRS